MIVDIIEMSHKYFEMIHRRDIDSMVIAKIWHHN
jgi:hypothetical protein